MKVYPIRNKEKLNKIELILKATNKRNYLLFVLGTNTGLRISDILKLKVQDVKGTFINVIEQKTQKKNTIKINKKLKEAIKEFLSSLDSYNDDTVLFSSRNGVNRPISIRRAQQIIKEIANCNPWLLLSKTKLNKKIKKIIPKKNKESITK